MTKPGPERHGADEAGSAAPWSKRSRERHGASEAGFGATWSTEALRTSITRCAQLLAADAEKQNQLATSINDITAQRDYFKASRPCDCGRRTAGSARTRPRIAGQQTLGRTH